MTDLRLSSIELCCISGMAAGGRRTRSKQMYGKRSAKMCNSKCTSGDVCMCADVQGDMCVGVYVCMQGDVFNVCAGI